MDTTFPDPGCSRWVVLSECPSWRCFLLAHKFRMGDGSNCTFLLFPVWCNSCSISWISSWPWLRKICSGDWKKNLFNLCTCIHSILLSCISFLSFEIGQWCSWNFSFRQKYAKLMNKKRQLVMISDELLSCSWCKRLKLYIILWNLSRMQEWLF